MVAKAFCIIGGVNDGWSEVNLVDPAWDLFLNLELNIRDISYH
jgi:hypothetical protein